MNDPKLSSEDMRLLLRYFMNHCSTCDDVHDDGPCARAVADDWIPYQDLYERLAP